MRGRKKRYVIMALWLAAVAGPSGLARSEEGRELQEHLQVCRYCQMAAQLAAEADSPAGRAYAPDRDVDILHIKLDVTPDFDRRIVSATTTLRFAPISRPLRVLTLDAVHLDVTAVRASTGVAEFVNDSRQLVIHLTEEIPVGAEAWVEVDHSAEPSQGFYFRTPEMGYPEGDTHVWTQGQTHEARHWFPCFDYPNERSTTEVICRVPQEMTVLSNGRQVSESFDEATQRKAVHWLQEIPHANYLICLVAGHLQKLEGQHRDIPLAFYTQPSLFEHAHNSFADTADIMAFFEEEIGVPFPWNKYYQVTIRDFTAGGMENTTLTTLTHRTIFSAETENLRSTRSLDAHEMAHQWFGDYVTCKDWSHLWLNEGFATYYASLYEGHKFGRDALLYNLYNSARRTVLPQGARDKLPVVYKGYRSPSEQFGYRAYPKGAWVLHMLRSQLGTDLYRQCIKTYLERHALSSVVTEELNAVIEELSGRSFDPFFDQWVYHGRHPDLTVEYRWQAEDKLARVTVRQTQEVGSDVLLFQFPTRLRFMLQDGSVVDREIEIRQAQHEFYVALPSAPKIVRFDPEFTLLADVTFRKPDDMLMAQLKNTEDVIGRLYAIEQLAQRTTGGNVQALQEVLQGDPFFGVRQAAARALRKMGGEEAFQTLLASRQQPDARVRATVVEAIGQYYRPEARAALLEVARGESNPAIAASAVSGLAGYCDDEVRELLHRSLRAESFGNEVAWAAIRGLRSQADASQAGLLLEVLQERREDFAGRSLGRAFDTLAELARDAEEGAKSRVYDYLASFVQDAKAPARMAAVTALGTLGDRRAYGALTALAGGSSEDRLAAAAKSALEKLDQRAPLVPAEVTELRQTVLELKQAQQKLEKELEQVRAMTRERAPDAPQKANGEDERVAGSAAAPAAANTDG